LRLTRTQGFQERRPYGLNAGPQIMRRQRRSRAGGVGIFDAQHRPPLLRPNQHDFEALRFGGGIPGAARAPRLRLEAAEERERRGVERWPATRPFWRSPIGRHQPLHAPAGGRPGPGLTFSNTTPSLLSARTTKALA